MPRFLKHWRWGLGGSEGLAEGMPLTLRMETEKGGRLPRVLWASSPAEILAQNHGQGELSREGFPVTGVRGAGPVARVGGGKQLGEERLWSGDETDGKQQWGLGQ